MNTIIEKMAEIQNRSDELAKEVLAKEMHINTPKKKQSFEEFLQERLVSDFPELCPTKDHFEDAYERFLEDLQIDDWIRYATQWETVINF